MVHNSALVPSHIHVNSARLDGQVIPFIHDAELDNQVNMANVQIRKGNVNVTGNLHQPVCSVKPCVMAYSKGTVNTQNEI